MVHKEVDGDAKYYKADNGNSDSIVEIVDSSEISTLITDSGFDQSIRNNETSRTF